MPQRNLVLRTWIAQGWDLPALLRAWGSWQRMGNPRLGYAAVRWETGGGAREQVIPEEDVAEVDRCLATLRQREPVLFGVILLRYARNLTYREIAQFLGVRTPKGARDRLLAAQDDLREILGEWARANP